MQSYLSHIKEKRVGDVPMDVVEGYIEWSCIICYMYIIILPFSFRRLIGSGQACIKILEVGVKQPSSVNSTNSNLDCKQ